MEIPPRGHAADDRCDAAMVAVLRTQSPASRLATLDGMWRSARAFVMAGIRAQHPDWADDRVARETARRMAGSRSEAR
ncbi:MAG: hypothetical protein ACKORL_14300 [Phycisphaerales bacterium]